MNGGPAAIEAGLGPYFYLPKLENHLEARLWNDVFTFAEERLGWDSGTIKATVLIETILAAFEMDEILYELRTHAAGLNAGRWDYIFSVIKTFRTDPTIVLPDRSQVTMTVPFMRSYTELQVATCHRRKAHAIGGMSAFIPNRRNPEVTERRSPRSPRTSDEKPSKDVTAPGSPIPISSRWQGPSSTRSRETARTRSTKLRHDVDVAAADLLDLDRSRAGRSPRQACGPTSRSGSATSLRGSPGQGAAAIDDLMEDVATAEISRSQIWQWVHHGVVLADGRPVTDDLVRTIADEEMAGSRDVPHLGEARKVFEEVALGDDFPEFLTLPAYDHID